MRPAARIAALIELIAALDTPPPRPADALLTAYVRARRYIGAKDRTALGEMFFRALRHWHRAGAHLQQMGVAATPRARAIADALLCQEMNMSELTNLFSGEETHAPPALNPEERAWAVRLEGADADDPSLPENARLECPDWAAPSLRASLDENFATELRALQSAAPLDLRVNTLKTTRDEVLTRLSADGFSVAPGALSPFCIRLTGRPGLVQHPLYRDGWVDIQDEGSQMAALYVGAQRGEQILDLCAGAGGKTLALAAVMGNTGRIVAMDPLARRLAQAKERLRRAGVHTVETRALDAAGEKWLRRQAGRFDRVVVDAPCSGTGTWRRAPDMRWRRLGPDLAALQVLQRQILATAARLVRPGGRLVYMTCSLLREENDHAVDDVLHAHADFVADGTPLRLTPARHGTDGFFAAGLRRA